MKYENVTKNIVKEIMEECKLGKEKANFIKLLIKICLDNEVNNFKERIISFLL